MAAGVSDFGAAAWLSALFAVSAIPRGYFLALCLDEPGAAMDGDILAGIEPVGAGYARQPVGTGPGWWAVNGAYLTNTLEIAYPTPVDDWGYVTHFALTDAADSGQLYAWGGLLNPQYVSDGVAVVIPIGALVLGLHALDNTIAA